MTKQTLTNLEILKKNLKVLIVDDHSEIRNSCKSVLIMNDYDVISASNGYDAIKEFVKHDPDLVIMDQMMPGINGTDTIQKMKKLNSTSRFILITADTTQIRLGKNDRRIIPVLSKPFGHEDLITLVDSILLFTKSDNIKNKNISVLLDDDIYEKMRKLQSKTILETQKSCSFSQIINTILPGNINT